MSGSVKVRGLGACVFAWAWASLGCGDTPAPSTPDNRYALTGQTPYPERASVGDQVRNVVVRYEVTRPSVSTAVGSCGLSALLFDVTAGFNTVATMTDGECRLYATPPEAEYARQRAVCAGAIGLTADGLSTQSGFCPDGARPPYEQTLTGCGGLRGGRSVTVQSLDEGIPGDVVTDLNATVTLPTEVTLTAPTNLPVTTWPESGDLEVTWTSAGATSAVVRLEPTTTEPHVVVICTPRENGYVRIGRNLITMGNLRTQESRVRVLSLKDVTVTAEGREYRVSGGTAASLILQGRR